MAGSMQDALAAALGGSFRKTSDDKKKEKQRQKPKKKAPDLRHVKSVDVPAGQNTGAYRRRSFREDPDTVYAPYNFVPLWEETAAVRESDIPSQGVISAGLRSGEISYVMKAETEIFTDAGIKDGPDAGKSAGLFYRGTGGRYALRASTVKGLVRSNAQILSLSSLHGDIEDYAVMYRNVASGIEQDRYKTVLGSGTAEVLTGNGETKQISVLKEVRAGYLCCRNGKYLICGTAQKELGGDFGHMDYFVVSEKYILDTHVTAQKGGKASPFSWLIKPENKLQHMPGDPSFVLEINTVNGVEKRVWKGKGNGQFLPFFASVSYELRGHRMVSAIGKPGKYSRKGYVLITGRMQNKKVVYIIPEIDPEKELYDLSADYPRDLKAFRIDYNRRLNTLTVPRNFPGNRKKAAEDVKKFFALPEEGEIKPVFYIPLNGRLYFGFTPRLRIYYDHTVGEGYSASHRETKMDYCRAIFGYSGKAEGRRSRVSFTDASAPAGTSPLTQRRVTLLEPKPTDNLHYVEPAGDKPGTYNDDGFRLRGVKQYHLHSKIRQDNGGPNGEIRHSMQTLPAGTEFHGVIRFNNLTDEELGLLLWSLQLEDRSMQNIGMAKSYGYGAVTVKILSLREYRSEKAYRLDEDLCLDPFEPLEVQDMISAYQKKISEEIGRPIKKHPSVKALLLLKDRDKILPENRTGSMSLDEFAQERRDTYILPRLRTLYPAEEGES